MKINKIKMLISTIIIFLPSLFYLVFSDSLSEKIAVHWGIDGAPDGFASPLYFALCFPAILAIFQWLCVIITLKTNSNNEQNKKVTEIIYWICPAISVYSSAVIYTVALGYEINIYSLMCIFFGALFMIIGNYMPKCKQNSTMGIKIKWTLTNEENWNATHRFAGKVWFFGGLVYFPAALLPADLCAVFAICSMIVIALIPTLYSYVYYRKQLSQGELAKEDFSLSKQSKKTRIISLVIVVTILLLTSIIMFYGSITVECNADSIRIEATYWEDISIGFNDISEIRFTESDDGALRLNGFGSARIMLGWFQSDKEDNHTRYTYVSCKSAVIITTTNGTKYIINRADDNQTKALYEELSTLLNRSEETQ